MNDELKIFHCPCEDCPEECEYFISDNNEFYGDCQLSFMGYDPEKDCAVILAIMSENN